MLANALALMMTFAATTQKMAVPAGEIVDLSHPYDNQTLYWPTSPSAFELERLAYGPSAGGWFYAANRFSTPEHGGTHLDAPIHFFAERNTVDRIPLDQLVGPAVVIDIREQVANDRDYQLQPGDIDRFESRHGPIARDAIVLLLTGFSEFWPDAKSYLGDDTPGDASNLSFPAFGLAAVEQLVTQRGVKLIGVDTASIDPGNSADFPVHRFVSEHNVPGLENLTRLDQLPPTGAWVVALPLKIAGGSGAPTRVIAILPRKDD